MMNGCGPPSAHELARSQSSYQPWIDAYRRGDSLDPLDGEGMTPLHHAIDATIGTVLIPAPAYLLLALGAAPDVADHRGVRPIHLACAAEAEGIVRLLMALGVDVTGEDLAGRSPRAMLEEGRAVIPARRLRIVELLGAPTQLSDGGPLPELAEHDVAHATYLLRCGARVDERDDNGNTALHRTKSVALVAALLARGADPNARNDRGQTPLHVACRGIGSDIPLLFDNGADPGLEDESGRTPIDGLEAQDYSRDFYDGSRLESYRKDFIRRLRSG